jgi:pimeloyl-ACP methyl ester carboxylesterase
MGVEHKFVLVNDVNIHYVESDSETASKKLLKTIVFLHGFPEYWGTWSEQLDYFSTNYRVIAPDLPGYNLSDKPNDPAFYAIHNLITFIAKFIKLISPDQDVYLVAHDWGGAIAWPLAAFHPQLIRKLIILNAAHPSTFTREMIENPKQRQKSAYIHELISASGESLLSKNNYQYLSEKMMVSTRTDVFTDKVKAEYRKIWSKQGAINGMLQYYRSMPQLAANDSETSRLESCAIVHDLKESPVKNTSQIKVPNIRVNVPTLILWGEQDQAFVIENLNDIEQYVPNCTIHRFSNTSHWLQHERPDDVNNAITTFITM